MSEPDTASSSRRIFEPPPVAVSAREAVGQNAFILKSDLVDACFFRRSPVLFVSFDNLASVGEYDPPQPWMHARLAKMGFSVLGLIARRKDWYRNADTPALLTNLRDAGLFEGFERIIFTGTSMGAYAALTYSRLLPGSQVLAFSPQTTLNREIAPFERRFKYGLRKWEWDDPAFLDAAEATPDAGRVWLFYDPMVPEDRAHAMRIAGPHVHHMKCRHFGHRLIRQVKACGVLEDLISDIGTGTFDALAFHKKRRARRKVRPWCRALLGDLIEAGHPKLARQAIQHLLKTDPKAGYLQKAQARLEKALRPTMIAEDIIVTDGDPQPPFTGAIVRAQHAIVVPEREHDSKLASGVLLADGQYCEMSRTWIRATKSTPAPVLSPQEPIEELSGRHLFAGHFRGHFGHFLVETTARLWALQKLQGQVDGILFLPYRGAVRRARRGIKTFKGFFDQLGISLPIQTFDTAMRVEELYVPELGFGWKERYAGSPLYRQFMRERLGRDIASEGSEKLYISRARLSSQRGGILGEQVIEENLARQGYEIFHPEKHPLEVQIARYKAAKRIVALDGSALHFAAFFMQEKGDVCIILRRSKTNVADYILQYQSFCSTTPDVVDVIVKNWVSGGARRTDFRSVGELDFAALFTQLKGLGYVDKGFKPEFASASETGALISEFSERRGEDFVEVDVNV